MKLHIYSIRVKFAFIFIGILCICSVMASATTIFMTQTGIFDGDLMKAIFISFSLYCSCGSLLMWLAVSLTTRPIQQLTSATKKVAKGNFDVRVDYHSLVNDEVGVLIQNFNQMAEKLENMEYMRKDFLSSVSHEFKTPIASIKGSAALLLEKRVSEEEAQNYLAIIKEEAGRLSNLVSNMLRLTNVENPAVPIEPVRFALDEQIRKTILLFTSLWEEKRLEMDIQLDKTEFEGDEELIQQIWINLIENAIKFSEENGTVSIYLRQVGDDAVVTIADGGIGIPEEKQAHIFEKFYQADPSHSSNGNGLGLSIVKSILDRIGGSVEVKSKEGQGAVFVVRLRRFHGIHPI